MRDEVKKITPINIKLLADLEEEAEGKEKIEEKT